MTKPTAVEKAKKRLDPTSPDEDAALLAQLIHNLGLQAKTVRYEMRANRNAGDEPYVHRGLPITDERAYELDDAGEAKTPEGKRCKSWRQWLDDNEALIEELWQQSDEEGNRRNVETELPKVQARSLAQMQAAE